MESEKILSIAAENGHLKVFESLLPKIEDKNPQLTSPHPSSTPLHIATKNGFENIVRFILDNDIEEKNPPDEVGKTPLHIAVKEGYSNLVEMLFNEAGDKNPAMTNGLTPLHMAAQYGDIDTIKLIYPQVLSIFTLI